MAGTASLRDFVEDELARAADLAARAHEATLRALREARRPGSAERAPEPALAQLLATGLQPFREAFVAALRERVHDEVQRTPRAGRGAAALELLDESAIDADIEISRAMQTIDTVAERELRELQTFTSALRGRRHVDAESNPLRSQAYAAALWAAVSAVATGHAQRAALSRAAAGELAKLLRSAWAAACSRLEARGVEPSTYRTVQPAPAGVAARAPAVGPSAQHWLRGLMVELPLRAGAAAVGREQVESLVAHLFDTIAEDERLGAACQAVMALLRGPVRSVALRDQTPFDALAHPVWQLLDLIAHECEGRPESDPWTAAFLRQAHGVAEALGDDLQPSVALFRDAVARLQAFVARQDQGRMRAAQDIVARLDRAEQRDLLVAHFRERLHAQLAPVQIPPAVRRFVLDDWSQVLAESSLRHGPGHATTQAFTAATDDLVWSLATPDHPQSRQRLLKMLPRLLQQLRDGMALAGMPAAAQQAALDALMAVHTATLHRRAGGDGAAELTPQEIVQRLRDEVVEPGAAAPAFGDSLIDLPSMETVPAELMGSDEGGAAARPGVDSLEPGAVRRIFLHGRWARARLLWRSPHGQYLLLVVDGAGRAQAVTRRALERLLAAGLVQPIESLPLVLRTVDSLMRRLAGA